MSKMLSMFLVIGLALVAFSPAQAQVQSDIATGRAELQTERQAIVAANLPLSEAQAAAFWPVYREYRVEMQKLGDRMLNLLLGYAKNFETLTDEQATAMLDDFLAIQKDEIKIKSDWVSKFRKILPPKAVTRFYQIENKLDVLVRLEAADQIPLVEHEKK
jgi:hypothetical protein